MPETDQPSDDESKSDRRPEDSIGDDSNPAEIVNSAREQRVGQRAENENTKRNAAAQERASAFLRLCDRFIIAPFDLQVGAPPVV